MSASNQRLSELVEQWCEELLGTDAHTMNPERLDELKDHLACVAEARMETGATVEEAMNYASEQFGDVSEIRNQLSSSPTVFRRWLARIHCQTARKESPSEDKTVFVSLIFAATLLLSAWLVDDGRAYAFIYTLIIATWVVLMSKQGGTRAAARAEWRWLKRKFGL